MGRKAKPTNLKVLEGCRSDRINLNEPKSPLGLGEPPEWFGDHARQAWKQLAERLEPMGVATKADTEAAMIYCQAYADWREAKQIVAKEGMVIESISETTTRNGSSSREVRKAHPLLPTIQNAQRQMMACLTSFGMTPSSRATLAVQPNEEDDELLSYLRAGQKKLPG